MDKTNLKVTRQTYSVCPVCLRRLPAAHVVRGGNTYLEKTCPEHGFFSAVIWRGKRDIEKWRGDLPALLPGENENCPQSCGLCSEHRQGTCCVLLEVTKRCNLNCAFCFASGGKGEDIPLVTLKKHLAALTVPGQTLVQLSGGEPAVRDDLPQIVKAAKEAGCRYVQLNTNGIRLAEDLNFVEELAEAGLSFVFMQFDGTSDEVYKALRGRSLLAIKERAIENCNRFNLGVTLVPTIVPKVNTEEIGKILYYAVSKAPAVRGVHFQPVSYFGRAPSPPENCGRFTLDELLEAIEVQAGELVGRDTLRPSSCDHPLCGFHGDYIAMQGARLHALRKVKKEGAKQATAEENREFVGRKWQRPPQEEKESLKKDRDSNTGQEEDIESLEGFLKRIRSHSFTVTAMAFQDAGNLDLERLRQCSLHVFDEGRLVPFCAYYLTRH